MNQPTTQLDLDALEAHAERFPIEDGLPDKDMRFVFEILPILIAAVRAGNELAERAQEYLDRAIKAEADLTIVHASGEDVAQMLVLRDKEADHALATVTAQRDALTVQLECRTSERDGIEAPMNEICKMFGCDDADDAPGAIRNVTAQRDAAIREVGEIGRALGIAQAQRDRAVEALEPFVRYLKWIETKERGLDADDENWFHDDGGELRAGEFRRARTVFTEIREAVK